MKAWMLIVIEVIIFMTFIGYFYEKNDNDSLKKKVFNYRKKVLNVIIVSSILLVICSGGFVVSWAYKNDQDQEIVKSYLNDYKVVQYKENETETKEIVSINLDYLKSKNKDVVGWLIVENTDISYPIVQYSDNQYYLNHSFDLKTNYNGWIFADYRNNLADDNNLIIYGHNRFNGTMFGTLGKTINKNWINEKKEHFIKLLKDDGIYIYQIFSAYTIEAESYYITTDFSKINYNDFLQTLKNRSKYDFNVKINSFDKIITLSTCTGDNTSRLAVHAKLVSIVKTA